jgi:rhamnosyltransferase subunit B
VSAIALVTFGSAGDVHPMLAIGHRLRQRGHRVVLLTNPAFADDAARVGLEFRPVGSADDLRQTVAHPKLWHSVDGFGVMWRYLLRPALEPSYQALAALAQEGVRLVVASPVAMGARVAQEKLGLRLVSAYTAATMLRTLRDPMTIAQWRVPAWLPASLRRLAWAQLDRHKLQPLVLPALEQLRGRLGLAPLKQSVFGEWMHSPDEGVALFPAWFAAAPADWPPQVQQAGFPLYDDETDAAEANGESVPLPAPLAEFLARGSPPVVFMPGTAAHSNAAFYQAALAACHRSGQRGVLLGPVPDALAASLPATVHAQPYASFAQLLPVACALVHHGGIGSCAQALRAGIPQVMVPQAYDQFDNAMRVERLGVGQAVQRAHLSRMGDALAGLMANPQVAAACAKAAVRLRSDDARAVVASVVERLA